MATNNRAYEAQFKLGLCPICNNNLCLFDDKIFAEKHLSPRDKKLYNDFLEMARLLLKAKRQEFIEKNRS